MTDAARGWELEAKAMQEIEERFGSLLDTMADLRNRCYREFVEAEIPQESLGGTSG